jgi:hypothetical protein
VFILYAIPVGLVAGLLAGGRIEQLGAVRFRLAPLALLALAVQIVLFSPLAAGVATELVRSAYVATTVAVILVVLANLRLTGVPLIVLGAGLNLAAILANGGAMPAGAGALAALGIDVTGHAGSIAAERPALEPLTVIFALPRWMPLANIFSIGDVLIGIGVAIAIAAAMRPRPA